MQTVLRDRIERTILTGLVLASILATVLIFCYRAGFQRGAVVGASVVNRSWELASTNYVNAMGEFAAQKN
jgi:hypothetical protein